MASEDKGFTSMDENKQKEISKMMDKSKDQNTNPGNFANDRIKASEAGKEGGMKSSESG